MACRFIGLLRFDGNSTELRAIYMFSRLVGPHPTEISFDIYDNRLLVVFGTFSVSQVKPGSE